MARLAIAFAGSSTTAATKRGLRLVGVADGPVMVRERKVPRDPFGFELHGSLERPFGGLELAAAHLQDPEVRVGRASSRIQADSFLDFGDRLFDIPESGQGVTEEYVRPHIRLLEPQRSLGAGFGLLVSARPEQVVSCRHLERPVGGQEISGADVLFQRVVCIAKPGVGFSEPLPRRAKPLVELNGIAILDCRFAEFLLFEVAISTLEEALGASGRVPAAARRHHPQTEKDR